VMPRRRAPEYIHLPGLLAVRHRCDEFDEGDLPLRRGYDMRPRDWCSRRSFGAAAGSTEIWLR
jgi:hypothetical protein